MYYTMKNLPNFYYIVLRGEGGGGGGGGRRITTSRQSLESYILLITLKIWIHLIHLIEYMYINIYNICQIIMNVRHAAYVTPYQLEIHHNIINHNGTLMIVVIPVRSRYCAPVKLKWRFYTYNKKRLWHCICYILFTCRD